MPWSQTPGTDAGALPAGPIWSADATGPTAWSLTYAVSATTWQCVEGTGLIRLQVSDVGTTSANAVCALPCVMGWTAARPAVEEAVRLEEQTWRAEIARAEAEWQEAQARATALLMAHLDAVQQASFALTGAFEVRTPTGRRLRICRAWTMNVEELDREGRVLGRYCAILPDLPVADGMLAQKLVLEGPEALFWAVANREDPRPWELRVGEGVPQDLAYAV